MDFWTALFLFFGGVLAQRAGSYLFFYSKKILFYNDCAFGALRMFKFVNDSVKELNKLKYDDMKNQNMDVVKIGKERETDEQMLQVWQNIAITGIKHLLPSKLRPMLRFNTWEEAMELLIKRDFSQGK